MPEVWPVSEVCILHQGAVPTAAWLSSPNRWWNACLCYSRIKMLFHSFTPKDFPSAPFSYFRHMILLDLLHPKLQNCKNESSLNIHCKIIVTIFSVQYITSHLCSDKDIIAETRGLPEILLLVSQSNDWSSALDMDNQCAIILSMWSKMNMQRQRRKGSIFLLSFNHSDEILFCPHFHVWINQWHKKEIRQSPSLLPVPPSLPPSPSHQSTSPCLHHSQSFYSKLLQARYLGLWWDKYRFTRFAVVMWQGSFSPRCDKHIVICISPWKMFCCIIAAT